MQLGLRFARITTKPPNPFGHFCVGYRVSKEADEQPAPATFFWPCGLSQDANQNQYHDDYKNCPQH
jgi:hypothetical protein